MGFDFAVTYNTRRTSFFFSYVVFRPQSETSLLIDESGFCVCHDYKRAATYYMCPHAEVFRSCVYYLIIMPLAHQVYIIDFGKRHHIIG